MQASRYFFLGSFFIKLDNRALVGSLLSLWHRPHYLKCHKSCTSYCCQSWTQNPATCYSLPPFLCYLVLAAIHERCRGSLISYANRDYKLICILDVILKKDQETWLSTYDFTWFWAICYSAKPFHLVHRFWVWLSYCGLISKALVYSGNSAGKLSLILGA